MKKPLLLLFSAIAFAGAAQEPLHCGADEMRIATLKQNPAIAQAVIRRDAQQEAFTRQFIQDQYQQKTATATYIIPVVFHIIHNYGNENISDAQVLDGVDILNKTFRKQLADTASIVQQFKPLHADCDIEFRLAQLDPNGNCTSGINRVASSLTTIGDHSVKALIHWPPDKYLNIYVVANAAGLAGHCVWPSDADTIPAWDGIVIGYNYVGSIGQSNYTQSVALAHECGHYLNLQHIWGGNNVPNFYYYPCADPNKDCSVDDLVSDTPPTIGWLTCNLNGASCGNTVDNVQNAMDYSYCNRMFTYGQKARMHACLNSPIASRNNLWQPANLAATGVASIPGPLCKANFVSSKTVICGTPPVVTFTNTSYNGPYTSLQWTFQGGNPATSTLATPSVTYAAAGSYSVSLKVKNGTDSVSISKMNYITMLPASGIAYPFSESFEATSSLHGTSWFSNSLDTLNEWQLTTAAASGGSKSVMLNNFGNGMNTYDELYGPPVNLSGASAMNISFKYAFAQKDTANKDVLKLMITNNCSTWVQRLAVSGSTLSTAPVHTTPFTPAGAGEWKQASVSVPAAWLSASFRFKFAFTSAGGNNLYLDDINIGVDAGVHDLYESLTSVLVFPNPASDAVSLRLKLEEPRQLDISLVNMLGQTVQSFGKTLFAEGEQEVKLPLKNLPAGLYFITLSDKGRSVSKPLVIGQN